MTEYKIPRDKVARTLRSLAKGQSQARVANLDVVDVEVITSRRAPD